MKAKVMKKDEFIVELVRFKNLISEAKYISKERDLFSYARGYWVESDENGERAYTSRQISQVIDAVHEEWEARGKGGKRG